MLRRLILFTAMAVSLSLAPWSALRAQTTPEEPAPPAEEPPQDQPPAQQPPQQPQLSVAVVDTGTNAPVNLVGGFNFISNNQDLSDQSDNNHGTTSALLVDEQAPGIAQYHYVVAAQNGGTSPSVTDAGIFAAAANPDVRAIAVSEGSQDFSSNGVAAASNANKFVAIPAGNNGRENPTTLAVSAFQLPGVLIVSATDAGGAPLPGMNNCGATAERCVRTLGVTPFNTVSGTSFASARMAGIAAAVLRVSPFLTAEQLVQVIIAAAEDRGVAGVDAVYGQGFVRDAGQVINNPAGPPGVPGDDGGSGSIAVAALVVGVGAGAALLINNKKKLKKTLVLDSFGRPFWTDLSGSAQIRSSRPTVSSFFDSLDERYAENHYALDDRHEIRLSYSTSGTESFDLDRHHAMAFDPAFSDRDLDWSFSLRNNDPYGLQYVVNRNLDPGFDFGALGKLPGVERDGRATFLSGYAFASPFLGFADAADSVALGFNTLSGMDVSFGVVNMQESTEFGRESVAAVLEGSYDFSGRGSLSAQFGRLTESGSLFGGSSGGALSVDETETYAVSLTGTLQINETLSMLANYGQGYSSVDDSGSSLLRNFSNLHSDWFGMGLIANRLFNERDQWGLAVSQPLRVYDGDVDMSVPYATDFIGKIYRTTDRVGLAPDGREYTVESFYRYRLDRRTSLGAFVMYREQPDHVRSAASEVTVLGTVRMQL